MGRVRKVVDPANAGSNSSEAVEVAEESIDVITPAVDTSAIKEPCLVELVVPPKSDVPEEEPDPKQEAKDYGFEPYLEGADMFLPDKTEKRTWYVKVRQTGFFFDKTFQSGNVTGRDQHLFIKTGLKYNALFKNPCIIHALEDTIISHETFFFPNVFDIDGEATICLYCLMAQRLRVKQGMSIAEIFFVKTV